jgi:hypothetical protein
MATQWTAGLSALTPLPAATLNTIGAAWETWTPTVTQSVNVTFTTAYARYARINKIVIASCYLTMTSAGTGNNRVVVTMPINFASTVGQRIGSGLVFDTSATTSYNAVVMNNTTATGVWFVGDWSGGDTWGVAPNIALASGDNIGFTVAYEGV